MNDDFSLKKIAIIPIYVDTDNVVKVLDRFPDHVVDKICVVVDCPTRNDIGSIQMAARNLKTPVHIIANKRVQGIGRALKKGIKDAINEGYDIAVIMAGNNKDEPNEIPRLLRPIIQEGYDYVQGSRFLPGGKPVKNPLFRKVFSRIFPLVWNLLTATRCTDVTNGFRAYKISLFQDKRINIRQDWLDGYQLEYYIHYKVLTLGYKVKEVPVSKIYPYNDRGGYSHISPLRDWWAIIGPIIYLSLGIKY